MLLLLCDSVFSTIYCYSVALTTVVSMLACIAKPNRKHYLKIDMSVWEPVGTSFIEEVNVFDQEAEERNNNLEGKKGNTRLHNGYN